MKAELSELSLNRRIEQWKHAAKDAQRREQAAVDDLVKAEAALRNIDRERAREKRRADLAESILEGLSYRVGAA